MTELIAHLFINDITPDHNTKIEDLAEPGSGYEPRLVHMSNGELQKVIFDFDASCTVYGNFLTSDQKLVSCDRFSQAYHLIPGDKFCINEWFID